MVAPISAPMLQMVAIPEYVREKGRSVKYRKLVGRFYFLPVQDMDSVPGPWYSIIAPVPPATVKMSATFKMTSLGAVHPFSDPVKRTPIT